MPGEELTVGFTVQRGLKTKVKRNYLKRKLRELWRINYRDFNIRGKLVIIIRLIAMNQDFISLEKDFRVLLKKASE